MAIFELTASPAKPSGSGFSVTMYIDGRPDPVPARTFEAKDLARIEEKLSSYIEDCTATGLPLAVSLRIKEGRAPNGFKAWKAAKPYYHRVNV